MTEVGEIEDVFTTLINPHRDIGAGYIHGVHASDLTSAPSFEEIAPYLSNLLAGRLLVAHNAWFDLSILARGLIRADLPFPAAMPAVCTMRMCSVLLGDVRSRELACEYLSIESGPSHNAEADVLSTIEIFNRLLWDLNDSKMTPGAGTFYWDGSVGRHLVEAWEFPALVGEAARAWRTPVQAVAAPAVCSRDEASQHRVEADTRIARLISRLPAQALDQETAESPEYLALLDRVLLDRLITPGESAEISHALDQWGISVECAQATHRRYLSRLVQAAMRDGVVTDQEEADLQRVCTLLGVEPCVLDEILSNPTAGLNDGIPILALQPGDRITFTGDTSPPRKVLEHMAQVVGLEVKGLAKSTKALVAADPNSESGKARKAHEYGIPVVGEQVFLYALESLRDASS
jgi:DNA polymerase III subunit epsilon